MPLFCLSGGYTPVLPLSGGYAPVTASIWRLRPLYCITGGYTPVLSGGYAPILPGGYAPVLPLSGEREGFQHEQFHCSALYLLHIQFSNPSCLLGICWTRHYKISAGPFYNRIKWRTCPIKMVDHGIWTSNLQWQKMYMLSHHIFIW